MNRKLQCTWLNLIQSWSDNGECHINHSFNDGVTDQLRRVNCGQSEPLNRTRNQIFSHSLAAIGYIINKGRFSSKKSIKIYRLLNIKFEISPLRTIACPVIELILIAWRRISLSIKLVNPLWVSMKSCRTLLIVIFCKSVLTTSKWIAMTILSHINLKINNTRMSQKFYNILVMWTSFWLLLMLLPRLRNWRITPDCKDGKLTRYSSSAFRRIYLYGLEHILGIENFRPSRDSCSYLVTVPSPFIVAAYFHGVMAQFERSSMRLSNDTWSEAMHNVPSHQLPWYNQPQRWPLHCLNFFHQLIHALQTSMHQNFANLLTHPCSFNAFSIAVNRYADDHSENETAVYYGVHLGSFYECSLPLDIPCGWTFESAVCLK